MATIQDIKGPLSAEEQVRVVRFLRTNNLSPYSMARDHVYVMGHECDIQLEPNSKMLMLLGITRGVAKDIMWKEHLLWRMEMNRSMSMKALKNAKARHNKKFRVLGALPPEVYVGVLGCYRHPLSGRSIMMYTEGTKKSEVKLSGKIDVLEHKCFNCFRYARVTCEGCSIRYCTLMCLVVTMFPLPQCTEYCFFAMFFYYPYARAHTKVHPVVNRQQWEKYQKEKKENKYALTPEEQKMDMPLVLSEVKLAYKEAILSTMPSTSNELPPNPPTLDPPGWVTLDTPQTQSESEDENEHTDIEVEVDYQELPVIFSPAQLEALERIFSIPVTTDSSRQVSTSRNDPDWEKRLQDYKNSASHVPPEVWAAIEKKELEALGGAAVVQALLDHPSVDTTTTTTLIPLQISSVNTNRTGHENVILTQA